MIAIWFAAPSCRRGLLLALLLGAALPSPAAAVTLKVMTFNIKSASVEIGFDQHESWDYIFGNDNDRRSRVVSVINDSDADIVGVQEMRYGQLDYLDDRVSEYAYYGVDRNSGSATGAGERSGIFYKSERFDRLGQGDFWLSATPATPGTTFVGNGGDTGNARMATWVKLHDRQAGQDYFVINTHWSLDSEARRLSGLLMRDKIIELAGDMPIIATGDFNENAGRQGYTALTRRRNAQEYQLANSFAESGTPVGKTFHGYDGGVDGAPIDFVLHTPEHFHALDVDIVRTAFGGYFPSDHYPVLATYEVAPLLTADYDDDRDVDGADFLLWQRTLGQTVAQGSGADGNRDRQVNAPDLALWRDQFGRVSPFQSASGHAVPEPGAALLAAGVCSAIVAGSRRQRRPRSIRTPTSSVPRRRAVHARHEEPMS